MNESYKKIISGMFLCSVLIIILIVIFFNKNYPIKFRSLIKKYANEYNLSESLVASVINVESGYDSNATSKAGAKGLMQIMEKTGEEIAFKLKTEGEIDLFEVETNIKYGCFYLRYLIDYYEDETLALCAYNAGLKNVNNWVEKTNNFSEKNIPFAETKGYIKKIKSSKYVYKRLYGFN